MARYTGMEMIINMETISMNDKRALREIGKRYMEIATLPVQKEKIELWKALNRSKMLRPMVVIDQLPWHELNNDGELNCVVEDSYWRSIESELRQTIYKWKHFPVDMVLDPYITLPKAISNSGYGIRVREKILSSDAKNSVVSHQFENQLKTTEDIGKFKEMVITNDTEKSKLWLDQGLVIFDGIAPVKSRGVQFHLGIWDYLTTLMGVESIYFDFIDRPEFLHALMNKVTESTISGIKQANELMIHDDIINTCHCSYTYTDELLPNSGEGKGPISKNSWAFGLAQLFSSVSPAITEEFEIPYITKMAEQFGMIYYGCCDRLDDRLDLVKKIPNVRKVSCSPWSKREAFAEKIGRDLIMSNKPTPAYIATKNMDCDEIRKDLEYTCKLAQKNSVNLEIILKDISTVNYEPERLNKWAEIAMDVVENY